MNTLFDWAQVLLLAFDPERAHGLAVKSLELGFYPSADAPDDQRLAQTVFGLDFPNPVGMAAGFDKNARVPLELLAMGFGFVEVGTVTPRPQGGNPSPRMFRSSADRAVINRLGFNNEGQLAALARLKERRQGIIGVNIGAGRDAADRVADYIEGVKRMVEVASYFTVNISSPNTPGLRDLQAPQALDILLKRVEAARRELGPGAPPLLVKLAPDLADADLPEVTRAIVGSGTDGIVVSNTTLARHNLNDKAFAREGGGLSGRPLFDRATRMLARVYQLTEGKLPLIGVGGIDSGDAALAKVEAGATLIQLYTGLVFEGPGLIGRIKQALVQAMEASGIDRLSGLTGRRAGEWAERRLPEVTA
ncbi:MAG: quinone-dependent dihydroorotate dehydrogenase [Methyloceanibacter sp.]